MEIEVLLHLNTKKYFVLLDDSRVDRFRIINPAGAKLLMPSDQFDEEPVIMSLEEAKENLSELQYSLAVDEFKKEEANAEQFIAHVEKQAEAVSEAKKREKMRPAPLKRKPRPKVNNKRGLGATWSSGSLTFYRHHIDPLGPKQSFRIHVDSVGTVEMTREDFQSVFNDVVMSSKYRQEGYYSYESFPEKAQRFLKGEA